MRFLQRECKNIVLRQKEKELGEKAIGEFQSGKEETLKKRNS